MVLVWEDKNPSTETYQRMIQGRSYKDLHLRQLNFLDAIVFLFNNNKPISYESFL